MRDKNKEYSLGSLAEHLNLTLEGDPDTTVSGVATLQSAAQGDLSFYHNTKFFADLKNTSASVVILNAQASVDCPVNKLISDNPYLAYARASQLFSTSSKSGAGIHPSATIHASARIGKQVQIGPNVCIGADSIIGDHSVIGANCVVGDNCRLGESNQLAANVTLYDDVRLGNNVNVHSGAVIGCDGFGYARDGELQVKIAQLGGVEIGNNVDIGSCSTIDRGALEDTVIADGVKIDNQVQIAHNVRVGENSVICGCSAVAGSSTIGKNCIIAGAVGIINHVHITDGVTVTAMSLVNKSINKAGIYSSGTALTESALWKKNIVHFKQLDSMNARLKKLESSVAGTTRKAGQARGKGKNNA